MDKEKVKKGLECCSFLKANTCRECPYWNVYGSSECAQMAKDALELLKEQEEIVRCKDCTYLNADTGICIVGIPHGHKDTFYCAYGKRR